ncbi:hypothetical protein [Lewinella sp. IMCC34183]|uniref:hypothetical protein n=1 Tax=Lewinella sp. IMCC34183 TaxID=2248762 RepID=UPI0013001ADC|nr:hypothetical protein [Lewinella sp. IMCC34183]
MIDPHQNGQVKAYTLDILLDRSTDYSRASLENLGFDATSIEKLQHIRLQLAKYEAAQQEEAKRQQQRMEASADHTFRVIQSLKDSLETTLAESQNAQIIAKSMYVATYLLGFAMVCVAIYFGTRGREFLSLAFGTFGMASIVGLLLSDPPLKLQDSRSNYSQLTIGVLAWFSDMIDKSSMQQTVLSTYQLMLRHAPDLGTQVQLQQTALQNHLQLSDAQLANTVRLIRLLEEVAEPSYRNGVES